MAELGAGAQSYGRARVRSCRLDGRRWGRPGSIAPRSSPFSSPFPILRRPLPLLAAMALMMTVLLCFAS